MIEHLAHDRIDKQWWDRQLLRCANRMWYAQSRVLDIGAPGWQALIDKERSAMMPLTLRSRLGISYLFQPYGTQQLGVFAEHYSNDLGQAFLHAIPKNFKFADIALNEAMAGLHVPGMKTSPLDQQVLPLEGSYEQISAGYSTGTKRNLKKVLAGPSLVADITAREFRQLYQRTTARRFNSGTNRDHLVMEELIEAAIDMDQCRILGIRKNGTLHAAACFMEWEGRSIFFKSAADDVGKELFGMFRIVDGYIAANAGSGLLLDFAGSNTPSVARFNSGFGARSRIYLRLQFNRLPIFLRWIKN